MTTSKKKTEVIEETEEPTEEEKLATAMEEAFNIEPEETPEETPEPSEDAEPTEEAPEEDATPEDEDEADEEEDTDLLDKYATPVEPEPDKVKLQEFENYLGQKYKKLQETNEKIAALNTQKDDKGVGILEMTDEQFSDYLQTLQDTGKMELSAKAQYNRNKAVDMYAEYTAGIEEYKGEYNNYTAYKESVEDAPQWTKAGDEFETSYPGFRETFGSKVKDFLTPLLDKDSQSFNKELHQLTRTDEGKKRAVVQALQHLGLLEDVKALANAPEPKAEKKPSAPDVTAKRKKVQVKSQERDLTADKAKKVASMSQKEFNKLSDEEITAAMFASLESVSD